MSIEIKNIRLIMLVVVTMMMIMLNILGSAQAKYLPLSPLFTQQYHAVSSSTWHFVVYDSECFKDCKRGCHAYPNLQANKCAFSCIIHCILQHNKQHQVVNACTFDCISSNFNARSIGRIK